jgi:transcriptional regulator, LysR family
MEIRQLHSFIKIVELQSFSKAAEALGYTQAAVTIQIRQLELEFNTRFFDRVGRHVELTPPGKKFLMYANEILRKVDDVHALLGNAVVKDHRLRIGTLESLLSFKLPKVVSYFYKHFPTVALEIRSGTPKELNEMLDHNQIDLAYYIDQKVYGQNWEKTLEEPESVVFVASNDANLPDKEDFLLAELLNQPFFLTEKDSNYRYALEQELASRHLGIRPFFETRNPDVIIELIKENRALSFLPHYAVEESLKNGSLRLLKVRDFEMQMYRQLFYHKDKWITEEMKNFIALGELSML